MMRVRARALVVATVCLVLGISAQPALGATKFRPRVGHALGLFPLPGQQPDLAAGEMQTPVTYHGGSVMTGGVTVHTIFWTGGATDTFNPAPGNGAPGYEGMIQQFLGDVAASHTDTGGAGGTDCTNATNPCSAFTVLPQFAQESNVDHSAGIGPPGLVPGENKILYTLTGGTPAPHLTVTGDSIVDADSYPAKAHQCASPQQTPICITDQQVQDEVDSVINAIGGSRGLNDIWYVFLPGGVDECILPGVCGSNAFGGYHSLSNLGNGTAIYAVTPDASIFSRTVFEPGQDPNGNPDAENAVDVVAHEVVEAMTDPEGVGYLDPNGFEVADKCEFGPQLGRVLGNAGPDDAPFNQVIGAHKYLLQEMWANQDVPTNGSPSCVQSTQVTAPPGLPLPQVDLTQFSQTVTGNIGGSHNGVGVVVTLRRAGQTVATSNHGTTDGNGTWMVTLPNPVGDDRDEIDIAYSGPNAPQNQTIFTGNGGDPFGGAGWTGWFALDNGTAVTSADQQFGEFNGPSFMIGPCLQVGVLGAAVGGSAVTGPHGETSPTEFCGLGTDVADMPLAGTPGPAAVVTASSNDNRAFIDPNNSLNTTGVAPNPLGALVKLTVPVSETDAVGPFPSPTGLFAPGGIPTCTADLAAQRVSCSGLVPNAPYTLNGAATGAADLNGNVSLAMTVHRGDAIVLSNGSRTLTTLHVANLRVDLAGDAITGGTCSPDQYFGAPITSAPISTLAGFPTAALGTGSEGTGHICPDTGSAADLPADTLAQTDQSSGGQTVTEVADVADTSPLAGETMFGSFTALADATVGAPPISLAITHGASTVFSNSNVDTASGVVVPALSPGIYTAIWTVSDANGDTRTVSTRFVEQSALQGPQGAQGPQGTQGIQGPPGPQGPAGPKPKVTCKLLKHSKIKCTVTFPESSSKQGIVRLAVARGGKLVALGHTSVSHGRATLTMRELRVRARGAWQVTVVYSRTVKASTNTVTVSVR